MAAKDPASDSGPRFSALVLESNEWVHRRVERIVIEPTGECSRHISLDFTVPDKYAVRSSHERVLVPLGLLRKGPLAAFSAFGPDGSAISVLETSANANISRSIISAVARNVIEEPIEWVRFDRLASVVVSGDPGHTGGSVDELAAIIRSTSAEEVARESLIQYINQFAKFFLLIVELDEAVVGRRTIVKYTYRETREQGELRPLRPIFKFDLSEFGAAASTHFELTPPPLMVVIDGYISDSSAAVGDEDRSAVEHSRALAEMDGPATTCHLVAKPNDRLAHAVVTVRLAPRPYGAMTAAWIGAFGVTLTLAMIVVARYARARGILPIAPPGSGTAAVLIAGAGLLMTWIARAPEDWTTSQILANARRSLMVSAVLTAGMAILLAVPVWEPGRSVTWRLLLALATINLAVAVVQRIRCRYGKLQLQHPGGGSDDDEK